MKALNKIICKLVHRHVWGRLEVKKVISMLGDTIVSADETCLYCETKELRLIAFRVGIPK